MIHSTRGDRDRAGAASGIAAARALILCVLCAAVAGAFFLWQAREGRDATPPAPILPEASPEDEPELAAPIAQDAFDPGEAMRVEAESELPEGLRELSTDARPAAKASTRALVVQVWNGKEGVPALETEVFYLDGFEGPELRDPFAQHWSSLAEAKGQRFETDLQGRVTLPPIQSWAIVTAQCTGAYGFAKLDRGHRDVETITLRPDETLRVRVVDDEDRPVAEMPVGVVQRIPVRGNPQEMRQLLARMKQLEQQAQRVEAYVKANPGQREAAVRMRGIRERQARLEGAMRGQKMRGQKMRGQKKGRKPRAPRSEPVLGSRVELRAQRRTDSEGIAVFRHFQTARREPEKWWPPQEIDRFEAVLLMPLAQHEARSFAGRPAPRETIELRLPATGSVALRPVDHEGRPFAHPVQAVLRVEGAKDTPWARVGGRKRQNEAAIVLGPVGLGLRFTAQCRLDDDDFSWSVASVAGPTNPDERVTLDLVVAPKAGMLHGRLLDEADRPLAGLRATFLITSTSGRLEGEDLTLDPEGRFHLPFKLPPNHRPPYRLEIRRPDLRPTVGHVKTLPSLVLRRVTELGDLRLARFASIAKGRVVDDAGEPIAGASVQLQREREVGGRQARRAFVDEAFALVRSDADGRYELFAELEPGRYRLRAQAKDHFPLETPDLRPGQPADLELLRKSRIVGTVRKPPWLASRAVRTRLELAGDPKQRRDDQLRDYGGKTYVFFDWIRPGIYNLSFRTRDFPDPFLRVEGLELRAGQQGLHPRLADLDLGQYLHRFVVAAVDQDGKPLEPSGPLIARIGRPDGSSAFVGFPWRGNRIQVVHTSPQLEVWPMSAGYRAAHGILAPGASELRFLRIPPVALHAPGLRQLVGQTPVWLAMALVGATGLPDALETWDPRSNKISQWYGKVSRNAAGRVGNGDSVLLQLMRDGRYRVTAYIGNKAEGGLAQVELGAVDVRLVAGARPKRVSVSVDAARVQAALAELARRRR